MATLDPLVTVEPSESVAVAPSANTASEAVHPSLGRLGPWQLLRNLSDGQYTRLYQARPANHGEGQPASYVIKVLRNQWWRNSEAIARQRREVWIGSHVSHPNIGPVLSAGVDGPPFYFVMPKLPGSNLAQMLDEGYRPAIPVAIWIVRQIAEGLAAVYEQTGMMHADVKPANMIVAPTGHTTLIDFGFAHSSQEASSWTDRPVVGTLNYIAPEMLTSTLAADIRSDIYSLGITLYELLTQRLPLESDDPHELVDLHRQAKPVCIRKIRPTVPPTVAALVHQMLAKDPLRRPGNYGELVSQLVRLEVALFDMH
jgi:serine/threonine-protein kinase